MVLYNSARLRRDIGELILSGLDSLETPYVLFDEAGRLKYGNPQFFFDVRRRSRARQHLPVVERQTRNTRFLQIILRERC